MNIDEKFLMIYYIKDVMIFLGITMILAPLRT